MRHRNILGRLLHVETETAPRPPDPINMTDEERYYRIMRLVERARQRMEWGALPVNSQPADPEESRRHAENIERMRPRLEAAQARIIADAEQMGLTKEQYLGRRFPWVARDKELQA